MMDDNGSEALFYLQDRLYYYLFKVQNAAKFHKLLPKILAFLKKYINNLVILWRSIGNYQNLWKCV